MEKNMKKVLISVIVILITLTSISCVITQNSKTIKSKTWRIIKDKEWSNFDIWAGDGLYFYEENDKAYCKVKLYGSGVPVALEYKSDVIILKENEIHINIPVKFDISTQLEDMNKEKTTKIILILKGSTLIKDNREYVENNNLK